MMPTVLERLKQRLVRLEEQGMGDQPLTKQLRTQIEASEAFPSQTAEQLYRVAPVQRSANEEEREIVTEEEEIRAEAIRRLKVRHQAKGRQDQTQE